MIELTKSLATMVARVTSIDGAIESAQGFLARVRMLLGPDPALMGQLTEVSEALFNAQKDRTELLGKILEIQRESMTIDRRTSIFSEYELYALAGGALVLKPVAQKDSAPAHYICANCAEKGMISYLQPRSTDGHDCGNCSSFLPGKSAAASVQFKPRSIV